MSVQRIVSPDVPEVDPGLWSNCIKAGDFLFISGQVARVLVPGSQDIVGSNEYEQTKHIFQRIQHIVEAAGASMKSIVKMTIYVTDISQNKEIWRARREFFSGDFPASTLVEVSALGKPEMLVEIETVAYIG